MNGELITDGLMDEPLNEAQDLEQDAALERTLEDNFSQYLPVQTTPAVSVSCIFQQYV